MEIYTEGAGCIYLELDMFCERNKDEAREFLEELGFLYGDRENILDQLELSEWLNGQS